MNDCMEVRTKFNEIWKKRVGREFGAVCNIYKLILRADKFNENSALATIHFRFDESRACARACMCMLIIVQANKSFLLSFLFSFISIH